jgi:hypothetical protein
MQPGRPEYGAKLARQYRVANSLQLSGGADGAGSERASVPPAPADWETTPPTRASAITQTRRNLNADLGFLFYAS